MDNARTHHAKIIKKHMIGKSNKILYNVPYNPKTNPIEQVFSKIKNSVRRENTEQECYLRNAIIRAEESITTTDLNNFYNHSFN